MEDKDTTRELDNPQEEKKIKKAVNDISTDLSSLCVDVKSISGQLPSLVVTREEVNTVKHRIEKYDKELEQAAKTIKKGVDVRVSPAVLSETHVGMLDQIKTDLEARNKRWSTLCRAIASTGKVKVVLMAAFSVLLTVACMLLVYDRSPLVWAHRAFVAAEESHLENPAAEYTKAYVEMAKACTLGKHACSESKEWKPTPQKSETWKPSLLIIPTKSLKSWSIRSTSETSRRCTLSAAILHRIRKSAIASTPLRKASSPR